MTIHNEHKIADEKLRSIVSAAHLAQEAWSKGEVVECHRQLDTIKLLSVYVCDVCRRDLMSQTLGAKPFAQGD